MRNRVVKCHRQAALMRLFLRPHRRRIDDPAEGQLSRIEHADVYAALTDPVPQRLNGSASMPYPGETRTPQLIVTYPRIAVSPDPQVGVSARHQFPVLPSRRGVPVRVP